MFRSLSVSGGQSSSSPAGHGGSSPGLDSQESSWIGLLSVVSRPAWSFLQKYLPGRPRNPLLCDRSLVDEGSELLRQLEDLRCQHDAAAGLLEPEAGLLEPEAGGAVPWLTADSLREVGIESAEEINLCPQTHIGYFSSARTFLRTVQLSSSQGIKPPGGGEHRVAVQSSGGKSGTWWGSFWGGEESSQRGLLSGLPRAEDGTLTGRLCPQQPETTGVFVQSGGGWMLGENTGPTPHKEEPANNGGPHTVQNAEGSTPDRRLSISDHLSGSGAAACSEVVLTPDQDNGYSSLEEELVQMCQLYLVKAPPPQEEGSADMEEESCEEGGSSSGPVAEEEEEAAAQEGESAGATAGPPPQCQNKAIAFIMGCPCSDDDSSQSDGGDDDGFDSEGSSDLSSTDEDDEDDEESDGEVDSDTERLWSSLCRTLDPYNPRTFTARLHTGSTPPRTIPTSTPPSSNQSSPASSPDLTPLPPSSPPLSSPPSGSDVWDDSASASEVDEAESLRLWSSFSCSSDPYSPFNFQAPLRTREPVEAVPRARTRTKKASQTGPRPPHPTPAAPPEYRKEEAEERLDSGFSEPCSSSSTRNCSANKKVRFCDQVEEFFASGGEEEEDRRGPWEELARDRCRFLRRCQEVEQSIAYCLQPQHRRLVCRRLQDA
ncbi:protein phosphatase 1 regulatory subunit 15B isoform X2 [Dicentrarchus labrax]|uniref:Protein phosphatase 1 regulatory subunit 15A/B C-terminal domain-containing protein n=1 Tax=Dicentrarchus labrax TaxID=13489 RepID=A0A8C4IIJ3_DICLA|nr:protein phosphatase 1 regulatory subunit 15B isoform X2 [Dicentrarchus labrax]